MLSPITNREVLESLEKLASLKKPSRRFTFKRHLGQTELSRKS